MLCTFASSGDTGGGKLHYVIPERIVCACANMTRLVHDGNPSLTINRVPWPQAALEAYHGFPLIESVETTNYVVKIRRDYYSPPSKTHAKRPWGDFVQRELFAYH